MSLLDGEWIIESAVTIVHEKDQEMLITVNSHRIGLPARRREREAVDAFDERSAAHQSVAARYACRVVLFRHGGFRSNKST